MPRVKKLSAIESAIVDGYLAGGSLEALATVYNVSPGTIRAILKRRDVTLRKPGRRKSLDH
jgi:hypothetical protein